MIKEILSNNQASQGEITVIDQVSLGEILGNDQVSQGEILRNDQVSQGEETEGDESIASSSQIISSDNKELSVDFKIASSQCGILTLVLKHIWAKAIELLNSNQVLPAPGCAIKDRMVASSSQKMLHFVTATKDG